MPTRSSVRALGTAAAIGALVLAPALAAASPADSGSGGSDAEMGPLKMAAVRASGKPVDKHADQPSISADGRYVTYTSKNLKVVGLPRTKAKQVLRYDRQTGRTVLVSVRPDGLPGEGQSRGATMSADGRLVVFTTESADLLPGAPALSGEVVVARDFQSAQTSLISRTPGGQPPNDTSVDALVSEDASTVVFQTEATDITGVAGAVVYDLASGTSSPVTVDTAGGPVTIAEASVSGNGDWLVFASANAQIVDGDDNGAADVFLMERTTGEVTLVSRAADGTVADGSSLLRVSINSRTSPKPFTSSDAVRVLFYSRATDLAGAPNPSGGESWEVYVLDVETGLSELVTVLPDGSASDDELYSGTISSDGRYAAVSTQAFLAGGSGPLGPKVFVRDLERDVTRAASSNQWSIGPGLGGDKPYVVMTTHEELLAEDTDDDWDVYYRRVW
jgi:Tol biopolymer transport system component